MTFQRRMSLVIFSATHKQTQPSFAVSALLCIKLRGKEIVTVKTSTEKY
jgi:hypothetical protein